MKRVVSVFMVSVLALSIVLIGGPTAFAGESGGFTYEISNAQTTITKYSGEGGNVVIPNTLGGYPVTVIGGGAFFKANLTSVTIPNTVNSIEGDDSVGGAFEFCTELTNVSIPNSVTKISTRAFASCEGLPGITIPNSVTSIGDHAFEDCISLPSITIPNSVKSIGAGAFTLCKGLTQFIVDENNVAYSTQQGALLNKTKTSLTEPGIIARV